METALITTKQGVGLRLTALVRNVLLADCGQEWEHAQKVAAMIQDRIEEADWISLDNGTTLEVTFSPSAPCPQRDGNLSPEVEADLAADDPGQQFRVELTDVDGNVCDKRFSLRSFAEFAARNHIAQGWRRATVYQCGVRIFDLTPAGEVR